MPDFLAFLVHGALKLPSTTRTGENPPGMLAGLYTPVNQSSVAELWCQVLVHGSLQHESEEIFMTPSVTS